MRHRNNDSLWKLPGHILKRFGRRTIGATKLPLIVAGGCEAARDDDDKAQSSCFISVDFDLLSQPTGTTTHLISFMLTPLSPAVVGPPIIITDRIHGSFVSVSPIKWKTPHFARVKVSVASARKGISQHTTRSIAAVFDSKVIIDPSIGNNTGGSEVKANPIHPPPMNNGAGSKPPEIHYWE